MQCDKRLLMLEAADSEPRACNYIKEAPTLIVSINTKPYYREFQRL